MEKKRTIILIFTIIILFTFISSVLALDELTQIKKGYNWLQGKTVGKWANLNTKQHVFSLLALQYTLSQGQIDSSTKSLLAKSYNNGTCWSATSCNAVETALAKIALDSAGKDSDKATEWLNSKKIAPSTNLVWFLQLTQVQGNEMRCVLRYDTTSGEVGFDKRGVINYMDNSLSNCFSNATYWLQLAPVCANKTFEVSCSDSALANFLFKKENEWFVTSKTYQISPQGSVSMKLNSYCIAQGSNCDYESTLWTAYAFFLDGQQDIAKSFVPYLVIEANNSKKFLPQAILFKITGKDSYAEDIAKLQDSQGFIVPKGVSSAYNKYYDSSLAKMTGSAYKADLTKLKAKLLSEQKVDGSWQCSGFGCDTSYIRETAMILSAFWPSFEWRSECESEGYACALNCSALGAVAQPYGCYPESYECCNVIYDCEMKYGTCKPSCSAALNESQVPYTCSTGVCCKDYSKSLCITEIHGVICVAGQECLNTQGGIIPFIYASGEPRCCKGTCSLGVGGPSCASQGGVVCDTSQGKSCINGGDLEAYDTNNCCQASKCVTGVQTCAQMSGLICTSDEDCKDGVLTEASDTNGMATCCIEYGTCIPQTCQYESCEAEESCSGNMFETSDALRCCDGTCLASCSSQQGTPCNTTLSCKGTLKQTADTTRCCIGTCQKKGGFPWWIIIVIVILGVAGLLFYLIKTGKIKLKGLGKPKAAQPRVEFGNFPMQALPPRTLPPRQPMPMQKPIAKPMQPAAIKKKLPPTPKPSA